MNDDHELVRSQREAAFWLLAFLAVLCFLFVAWATRRWDLLLDAAIVVAAATAPIVGFHAIAMAMLWRERRGEKK